MEPESLKQIQEAFRRLLTADEAPGLTHPLVDQVVDGRGLEVYWEAYFLRFSEVFEEDFPALAREVTRDFGEGVFRGLVMEYLRAHPPQSANLNLAGRGFAAFVKEDAIGRTRPALVALARLEWYVVESFLSPQLPARGWEGMTETSVLSLAPSVRLLRANPGVLHLWDESQLPEDEDTLVIHRGEGGARPYRVSAVTFHLLLSASQGRTLGESLSSLGEVSPEEVQGAMAEIARQEWALGSRSNSGEETDC